MHMKTFLIPSLIAATLIAMPSAALSKTPLEGLWRNSKGSVTVAVEQCGSAYCGVVVKASAKAKEKARRGGTPNLVGTQIMSGMRAAGAGVYRGRAFDPKRNIHAPATIRLLGPTTISVKGCLIGGFICKEQRWVRVG